MSPRAVLNLALVSTLRLGARRQETFGSSLAGIDLFTVFMF
jgi:hypothetical protein